MRDWLKEKRTEKGMTMAEMAKRLDLSESYYSKIESGDRQRKMDIRLVSKLCKILDISIEEIIAKEGT
ncbi:MAG: helix-turn-helix transcriptional regulator [Ruminococcus sp.]|nr:helix-turn-helix transcriptional regulator [Ruminococcus sp.]